MTTSCACVDIGSVAVAGETMHQEPVLLESRENIASTPARTGAREESGRWRFGVVLILSPASRARDFVRVGWLRVSGCR